MSLPDISRRSTLLGAAAAGAVLGRPAAAAPSVLTVGAAVFPDSLLPGISSFASESLLKQTNEPLFARDNNGNLVPALALSATQVDDTTTRLALRQGVTFHDGKPFTAEDAAFTLTYILDVKNAYGLLARIAPIVSATAVDSHTLEIKTRAVFPTLLKGLSFILIQPRHVLEAGGLKALAARPIGTGPFVYGRWTPGDRYELTANKAYWNGPPKVERLVIREIPDPGTRIASLVSGETQIIEEVPVDLISQVEASSLAKMDEIVSTAALVLTYDTRSPPFDDPRVRLAFDYAVDKPAIRKEMLKNRGELLHGQLLTESTFGFNPGVKARPFDPDKAKALLKEAKFDFSKPIPITTQSGKYASDVDICNAVAGMLTGVGVKATVEVVEGGVFLQRQSAFKVGPIHMIGWYSLGDADFANVWYTKAGRRSVWSNEEYERLFVAGRSTNDKEARLRAYNRMAEILHEENPSMFLFGLPSLYGVNRKVTGFGAASDKCLRLAGAAVRLAGYMLRIVGRRLVLLPLSLFLVAGVTFVMLRLTGDPVDIFLDVHRTPEQVAELTARLHLDQPIPVQFLIFLGELAHGEFGESLQSHEPALDIVLQRLGATLQLAGSGLLLALLLGMAGGLVCAVRRDRPVDLVISAVAVAGQSMPSFWLGLLLIQLFALQLHWLPTSGMGGPLNLVLPAVTLATFLLPNIVLITRASILELAGENFVVAARAKGLSRSRVLLTHVLPVAFNPILSFVGVQVGTLIGGSIITETIFAWPGIGRLMLASISHRDVAVVEAGVLVIATGVAVVNLLVDLMQLLIDPRVRRA